MSMRQKKALAWSFFAVDVVALLFLSVDASQTSAREGQQGWEILLSILLAMFVAVGGGVFTFGIRRKSALGVGAAAAIWGMPLMIGLMIWIDQLR